MQHSLIISLMAEDRPGIVESIADVVSNNHGNWLESRLVRLGGQFTGVIQIQVNADQEAQLQQSLSVLNSQELSIAIHRVSKAESKTTEQLKITVVSNDRPGIVKEISSTIVACGANVEELTTSLGSVPGSGEALFRAEGVIALAESVSVDNLTDKLEALSDDLMVEVDKL